jgi:hypothetical protein
MIIVGWTQALVIKGLYESESDPVNYFSVQNNVAGQSNPCSCWHLAKFVVSIMELRAVLAIVKVSFRIIIKFCHPTKRIKTLISPPVINSKSEVLKATRYQNLCK